MPRRRARVYVWIFFPRVLLFFRYIVLRAVDGRSRSRGAFDRRARINFFFRTSEIWFMAVFFYEACKVEASIGFSIFFYARIDNQFFRLISFEKRCHGGVFDEIFRSIWMILKIAKVVIGMIFFFIRYQFETVIIQTFV